MTTEAEYYNQLLELQKDLEEKQKEINALRRALKSHGEICEMNFELKQRVNELEMQLKRNA